MDLTPLSIAVPNILVQEVNAAVAADALAERERRAAHVARAWRPRRTRR